MRLFLDEMWAPEIAEQLRTRGHDVLAVAERDDLRKALDPVVFEFALHEGRAILTEDAGDYRRLRDDALRSALQSPLLILTSNHKFPRGDHRTIGRVIAALDILLFADPTAGSGELWL